MYLEKIHSPEDVKQLDSTQLTQLASEIREEILRTVSLNGGHLASNLGVVELSIALLRAFCPPQDKILLDVGHQCYPYKLLTGRFDRFGTLRRSGGLSGFPQPDESGYDVFTAGHASTAISAALGLCRARDALGQRHHVVAVVGDGALTGGMCYEALNDAGSSGEPLIVIVNDNGMSISKNTGALSNYLTLMRTSKGWIHIKKGVSGLLTQIPRVGQRLNDWIGGAKDHIKNLFVHDTYFRSLGFRYFGPIDGHDTEALEKLFRRVQQFDEPVLIHVITQKGRGYQPAVDQPDVFHGIPPFYVESGAVRSGSKTPAFGALACEALDRARENGVPVSVVCAAMADGTGLSVWQERHPESFFDVGIAEEHAVTMAAGMARGGLRPAVAIYDTFLQRGYDQMLEDVCQQRLPVLFLMDRAGFSGPDGATHHGIFGLSYLLSMPGMRVYCPVSGRQLKAAVGSALEGSGPVAVRYPRYEPDLSALPAVPEDPERWTVVSQGDDCALLAAGTMVTEALRAAALLNAKGIRCRVYACCRIKPLDEETLRTVCSENIPVFTLEEHQCTGGFGAYVTEFCQQNGFSAPLRVFAVPDRFVPHGSRKDLLELCGLDAAHVADETEKAFLQTRTERTR